MKVKSYKAIVDILGIPPNCGKFYYRGVLDNQNIIPSIRYSKNQYLPDRKIKKYESDLLHQFSKVLSKEYNFEETLINVNNFDFWFMARHFHLNSRLIDFTSDLSVAIQFGMEYSNESTINIYAFDERAFSSINVSDIQDSPLNYNKTSMINPKKFYSENYAQVLGTSRMFIQSGFFLFQQIENSKTPITKQIDTELWKLFEIEPVHFDNILNEIRVSGVDINKPLLKEKHCLDKIANTLNNVFMPKS